MTLTYLGHSCFLVESHGYQILFDPYEPDSVPGYRPISVQADQVLCSHEHRDHHGVDQVTLRQGGVSPLYGRDHFHLARRPAGRPPGIRHHPHSG